MLKGEEVVNFSLQIEEIVYMKDVSYMDAVVLYCEENEMEVEGRKVRTKRYWFNNGVSEGVLS